MPESPPSHQSVNIFPIGEVLNGVYEIRSVLGAGGMGQVFEAQDLMLNRRVAIKAPWPDLRESIKKEAQALAAIRHPSMVTVHAMGEHQGTEYVVMERIYGVSLETHLHRRRTRGEPLTQLEVIDLLLAIGDGLGAIHKAGVAHRDIKPGNIMMAPGNRVVLMDFGLFLPEFEVASQTTVAGSPQYMAPEAISNQVQAGAGHLVDLYALGIMAFEMLTGDVPFSADELLDIWEMHLTIDVPDVRQTRPDVAPRLAELVKSLLLKDPTERPQNIETVSWQLSQIRESLQRPTARMQHVAAPPSPRPTARRISTRSDLSSRTPHPAAEPGEAQLEVVDDLAPPSRRPTPRTVPVTSISSAVAVAPEPAPPVQSSRFTVLIVDDDEGLRKVLSFYVKKAAPDAEIQVASDGDTAIEMARERAPHLMLLDMQMPRMNGIEVVMYMRGLGLADSTEIVLVSAGAQEHDVQVMRQFGVTRYIVKGNGLLKEVTSTVSEVRALKAPQVV